MTETQTAFAAYRALLEASSPVTRTPAQDHAIHEARMAALAARDREYHAKFWNH